MSFIFFLPFTKTWRWSRGIVNMLHCVWKLEDHKKITSGGGEATRFNLLNYIKHSETFKHHAKCKAMSPTQSATASVYFLFILQKDILIFFGFHFLSGNGKQIQIPNVH